MFCPVCNGMQPLDAACSNCGQAMEDWGRMTDWIGPYAPYVPLETEMTLWNQSADNRNCLHIVYCSSCERTVEAAVTEIGSTPLNSV
ncbi:hypothetical protein [Paenibacillus sp. ATY16]|uniref:hypothetical protein n=1 Tax=Paenibacillus sp. ATY16 TaxID=1759312 RepID=UPI00200E6F49|nr:hypothetical protein [Paenibacillus sp. ATY16]